VIFSLPVFHLPSSHDARCRCFCANPG
jgi:hypothetical protein